MSIPAGAGMLKAVRRFGTSPRGRTPARCAKCARGCRDGPAPQLALDGLCFGVDHDACAPCLRAPEETLVQPMDIHFLRKRFDECPCNILRPKNRHSRNRFLDADLLNA